LLAFGSQALAASSAAPEVTVDVGTNVECRDVSSREFSKTHPNEKLVEATFHISVLLKSGREEDLQELNLLIASSERRLRVIDFRPRTEVASELAGDVEVSSSQDTNHTLNASLGALFNSPHVQAGPGVAAGVAQSHGTKETYHRLAAKQIVLASGTVEAEHGVYFKWRRSTQAALEGRREVTVTFSAPRSWRGDWVQVTTSVVSSSHNYLGKRIESRSESQQVAGLYLVGDSAAQQAARLLSEAQSVRFALATASETPQKASVVPDFLNVSLLFKTRGECCPASKSTAAAKSDERIGEASVAVAIDRMRRLSGS
jgi:hypothetical protein